MKYVECTFLLSPCLLESHNNLILFHLFLLMKSDVCSTSVVHAPLVCLQRICIKKIIKQNVVGLEMLHQVYRYLNYWNMEKDGQLCWSPPTFAHFPSMLMLRPACGSPTTFQLTHMVCIISMPCDFTPPVFPWALTGLPAFVPLVVTLHERLLLPAWVTNDHQQVVAPCLSHHQYS